MDLPDQCSRLIVPSFLSGLRKIPSEIAVTCVPWVAGRVDQIICQNDAVALKSTDRPLFQFPRDRHGASPIAQQKTATLLAGSRKRVAQQSSGFSLLGLFPGANEN
jgi:hypothetical protein